ncbi:MAG: hypothetical protein WCT14_05790 [Treponemataceae bacterium]
MKRSAYLLGALLIASTSIVSAAPLPEPVMFTVVSATEAVGPGAEFPTPNFGLVRYSLVSAADLWALPPDPVGLDLFDPSLRVTELWDLEIDPQDADPFAPSAQLATLWGIAPLQAFDRGVGVVSEPMDFVSVAAFVQATTVATDATEKVDEVVLRGLLNNEHYRESIRLKKLAVEAFDYGDYDASASYAAEAGSAARRSDEYVALRLKIRAVDDALAKAKARLEWAAKIGAQKSYSGRFAAATVAYEGAKKAREVEDYDLALELARKSLSELASVQEATPLPQRYKVRPWAQTKDCFWTISGYAWVYGDATKWKLLYEANKAKLPRPENPNLLRIGTVITIPSIRGEYREGVWEKGKTYSPLPGR